jgi:hypothetical protein
MSIPAVFPAIAETLDSSGTRKWTALKMETTTNNGDKNILPYRLSPGTFGYALLYRRRKDGNMKTDFREIELMFRCGLEGKYN